MSPLLPSLIITAPRCVSSTLHQGLARSIVTHNAITADARTDRTHEIPCFDSRVTGDDYW
jgi:hypothetical protein